MKLDRGALDDIDMGILRLLQEDCKVSLARIGDVVGLSAPSVVERIKKLEQGGVIEGYHAVLNARRVGLDVTAFIGVAINHPRVVDSFQSAIEGLDDVLECHHVTGAHSILLKIKTSSTAALEELISKVRSIDGVERTETMIVLSTRTERVRLRVAKSEQTQSGRGRRHGAQGVSPSAA